jgi:hypothetical protein
MLPYFNCCRLTSARTTNPPLLSALSWCGARPSCPVWLALVAPRAASLRPERPPKHPEAPPKPQLAIHGISTLIRGRALGLTAESASCACISPLPKQRFFCLASFPPFFPPRPSPNPKPKSRRAKSSLVLDWPTCRAVQVAGSGFSASFPLFFILHAIVGCWPLVSSRPVPSRVATTRQPPAVVAPLDSRAVTFQGDGPPKQHDRPALPSRRITS